MIRKLSNITERKVYRDDSEIELSIMLNKGNIVENRTITQSAAQYMLEGEMRIDTIENRSVHKIDGKLYKQVVENDEVIFKEI